MGSAYAAGSQVLLPLIRPLLKTPQKSAATSIYLASSPEVEGVTGTYFVNSKLKTSCLPPAGAGSGGEAP
jgi:hypothetical protein